MTEMNCSSSLYRTAEGQNSCHLKKADGRVSIAPLIQQHEPRSRIERSSGGLFDNAKRLWRKPPASARGPERSLAQALPIRGIGEYQVERRHCAGVSQRGGVAPEYLGATRQAEGLHIASDQAPALSRLLDE